MLGWYSQSKVSSKTLCSRGSSQSHLRAGKILSLWVWSLKIWEGWHCPKEVTSWLSLCVILNWCSEGSSDFRVVHIFKEKQKEIVHKRRKKRHSPDARIPKLKGVNRDELAKIPGTEKKAFGLRKMSQFPPGKRADGLKQSPGCRGWRQKLGEELQVATVNPLEKFGSGLFLGYYK